VAECYRNLSAVGARPMAITNCLNFANPQRPEIMAQIVGCLEGMADACRALDFPIVSGNVSLYNESKATGGGSAILPTPAIGGVGLLDDYAKMVGIALPAGRDVVLIGSTWPAFATLGQSLWLREIAGVEAGEPPFTDLEQERRTSEFVRRLIGEGRVSAVHDVSDGGPLVAMAEMCLAGGCGVELTWGGDHGFWFGEIQGAYLLALADGLCWADIDELAPDEVETRPFGCSGGDLILGEGFTVPLTDLRAAHESFLRDWMESDGGLDPGDLSGN
jgi:phosphoribosylformylglycinamidine synthase subunit PurL